MIGADIFLKPDDFVCKTSYNLGVERTTLNFELVSPPHTFGKEWSNICGRWAAFDLKVERSGLGTKLYVTKFQVLKKIKTKHKTHYFVKLDLDETLLVENSVASVLRSGA